MSIIGTYQEVRRASFFKSQGAKVDFNIYQKLLF